MSEYKLVEIGDFCLSGDFIYRFNAKTMTMNCCGSTFGNVGSFTFNIKEADLPRFKRLEWLKIAIRAGNEYQMLVNPDVIPPQVWFEEPCEDEFVILSQEQIQEFLRIATPDSIEELRKLGVEKVRLRSE